MPGEDAHEAGRDGLRRAKRWLEFTSRVDRAWTHQDRVLAGLLQYDWPYGRQTFSFDLGGTFRGEGLEGTSFVAEVKMYKCEGDLPQHFRDFVAKCYVALQGWPARCDHFLWISWAPFQARKWDFHTTVESVVAFLLHESNCERVFGTTSKVAARDKLDIELVNKVAERLWLVTLGEKQERLVLTKEHYLEVVQMITREQVA